MKCSHRLILAPALIFAVAPVAPTRAAPAPLRPLPKNPDVLMQLAALQNGLEGKDIEPWHIRATWQIAAWKKSPAIQGSFEEWWTSPEHYKAVYSAPGFHQTLQVTAASPSITGDAQWPDPIVGLIDPLLRSPLPSPSRIQSMQFANQNAKDNTTRMRCAVVVPDSEPRPSLESPNLWFASHYCFNGDLPAIRMEIAWSFEVVFNSIVQFQGRYLAESIRVSRTGLPDLDIHVDEVHTIDRATASHPD